MTGDVTRADGPFGLVGAIADPAEGAAFTDRFEIVDLSMTVSPHWRFTAEIKHRNHQLCGFPFHSTDLSMGAHAFTHVDAPWHVDPAGAFIADVPLSRLSGSATIVDISDLDPGSTVDADVLATRGAHVRSGDIVLLRSDHERAHPTTSATYWTEAPFVSASGARWLLDRDPAAVGFDFPQDRAIRSPYAGAFNPDPDNDWACHDLLLTVGIPQIEYLANLGALRAERVLFFAMPLKLSPADGAPTRAFAVVPRT